MLSPHCKQRRTVHGCSERDGIILVGLTLECWVEVGKVGHRMTFPATRGRGTKASCVFEAVGGWACLKQRLPPWGHIRNKTEGPERQAGKLRRCVSRQHRKGTQSLP